MEKPIFSIEIPWPSLPDPGLIWNGEAWEINPKPEENEGEAHERLQDFLSIREEIYVL
jgi:hypothetical protein